MIADSLTPDPRPPTPLPRVSILVAVAENGVIGRDGKLPWHLGDDLRRFKELTMGHTIVMGRKTWESIGRPLPGRRSVVISRQTGYHADGAQVVANLDDAIQIAAAAGDTEVFVIGGAEVYKLAIPQADRLYITLVGAELEGDAFFPDVDFLGGMDWVLVESSSHVSDAHNDHPYTIAVWQRSEPKTSAR